MKTFGVGLPLAIASALGCSSSTNQPFTDCKIGSLTGTWRITYVETDGNCGKVAAETVVLSASSKSPGASSCMVAAQDISSDHCRLDLDFTCPLNGAPGTQHWAGVTHQVSATELTSSMTLTAMSPSLGSCRSTYTLDWTQQ